MSGEFAELMMLPVVSYQKIAAFAAETGWMAHRMDAFERSRERTGTTVERVVLVETPIGDYSISYLEGTQSYGAVAKAIRESADVFDLDMMNRGKVLHGLDEEGQRRWRIAVPLSFNSTAGERRLSWQSFAAVLASGEKDDWYAMATALQGARSAEFARFNEANGFTVFCAGIYAGPAGDIACYHIEGSADDDALPSALRAGGEFAEWFADALQTAHRRDLREGVPSPPVARPWDWVRGAPNEIVAPIYHSVVGFLDGGDRGV